MSDGRRAEGGLNESGIVGGETLYEGLGGQRVERIRLADGSSRILKSAPDSERAERERWVYDHVLPRLPAIAPRLLAGPEPAPGGEVRLWFEDLGRLDHAFEEEKAAAVLACAARWHALPPAAGAGEDRRLQGPKPRIGRMAAELLAAGEEGAPADMPRALRPLARRALELASREADRWTAGETAFSHGDLHSGNYALAGGALRVLDWEHAHWNSRYWDLYHVIDLSHPLFPKQVDDSLRLRLLRHYLEQASAAEGFAPPQGPEAFLRGYRLFAAVFSLWLLRLIERDLRADGGGPWPEAQLLAQREETLAGFGRNAREL